jgi:hypothetical protein
MTSIEELIAKLQAAQGPDRDLDCIMEAFDEKVSEGFQIVRGMDGSVAYWTAVRKDPFSPVAGHMVLRSGKPYTSSFAVAVDFAVRLLPEKWTDALREAISEMGRRHDWHICLKRPGQQHELPREICLQVLRIKAASLA